VTSLLAAWSEVVPFPAAAAASAASISAFDPAGLPGVGPRPVEPNSSDPPENTAVATPPSSNTKRQVGVRVAGGGQHPHPQGCADFDDVAVPHPGPLVADGVVGVHVVRGAGLARQRQPAGDIVVVDVGFEDVGDPDARGSGEIQDPVDVALRVDHERDPPIVDQIAAVPQRRRLDREDRGRRCGLRGRCPVSGWLGPWRCSHVEPSGASSSSVSDGHGHPRQRGVRP